LDPETNCTQNLSEGWALGSWSTPHRFVKYYRNPFLTYIPFTRQNWLKERTTCVRRAFVEPASPAVLDHTALPAIWHRWTRPAITSARQASTRFTYPGGMEGWVDLAVGYISRWFTCSSTIHVTRTW